MRVASEEQGVQFEWAGEPDATVRVAFVGDRDAGYERLELLQEVIRSQRHGGVKWLNLELRERHFRTGESALGGRMGLVWAGTFEDWQTAGMVFAVLCKAVGLDDPGVQLEVEL